MRRALSTLSVKAPRPAAPPSAQGPCKGPSMIGIPLGILYASAIEWASHRYLLHGLGKNKNSFWAYHWYEHHRAARRNDHYDPDYHRSRFGWHAQGKETLSVAVACLVHVPLFPIAPFFTGAAWYYAIRSYRMHKRAHLDPA